MLGSALSALSDRLDSKFLTAYWLPSFVAVLGGFVILAVLIGPGRMAALVADMDSVEQGLVAALVLIAITMTAFLFRALSRPIVSAFAGVAFPRAVAAWSVRRQLEARARARADGDADPSASDDAASERVRAWLHQSFPVEDADTRPTRLGNVLATAVEHPKLAYTMEGLLWWPRLAQLVPDAFHDALGGAQAPMMALLNLCIVFAILAVGLAASLGFAAGAWTAAILCLAVGALIAWLCYRAAVSQASELGSLLRVGFDLYRHEILRQLDIEVPADSAEERALWRRLTAEVLGAPGVAADRQATPVAAAPSPSETAPQPAPDVPPLQAPPLATKGLDASADPSPAVGRR